MTQKKKIYLVAVDENLAASEQFNKIFPDARVIDVTDSGIALNYGEDLAHDCAPGSRVHIREMDGFCVFVDGIPLHFEREKARELMAFLAGMQGKAATTRQIAQALWKDAEYDPRLKNQVTRTVSSLKSTLEQAGVPEILVKSWNCLALDTSLITFES